MQQAASTLDFSQPVVITLIAILHHIDDYEQARSIVRKLTGAVPSGSYLDAGQGGRPGRRVG